jgi:ribonuclease Z
LKEIYGPLGIRRYIRTCLELSRSYVTYKYIVHELIPIDEQIPEDLKNWQIIENEDNILHPSEILGSQINYDQLNRCWSL